MTAQKPGADLNGADDYLLLEPDDIDFETLSDALLAELAVRSNHGDNRIAMFAMGQLWERAWLNNDPAKRQAVVQLAKQILATDGISEHWFAATFSKLYTLVPDEAVPIIARTAASCGTIVLDEFIDSLWPDLQHYVDDPVFWRAASAVATRVQAEARGRSEDAEYLEEFRRLAKAE